MGIKYQPGVIFGALPLVEIVPVAGLSSRLYVALAVSKKQQVVYVTSKLPV
jgi:hypothetical protein